MFKKFSFSAAVAGASAVSIVAVVGLVGKLVFDLSTENWADAVTTVVTVLGLLGVHLNIPTPTSDSFVK